MVVKFCINGAIHTYTYVPIYVYIYIHVFLGIIQIHAFACSEIWLPAKSLWFSAKSSGSRTCIATPYVFVRSTERGIQYGLALAHHQSLCIREKDLCDIGV